MLRFFAALALVAVASGDRGKRPLKTYTINLDLAPEERFVKIVKAHKYYIKVVVNALGYLFRGDSAKQLLSAADRGLDNETRGELQGVAAAIGLTWDHVLKAHLFYELSGVTDDMPAQWRSAAARSCTGIVAQNANGTVMMARNQDYPPAFSPLQYHGTFMKGGKVLFEATSFAGIIGIGGTCMVPGAFSAEINARYSNTPSLSAAMENAANGGLAYPLFLRKGCERGGSFEDAVKHYSEAPLVLGGYVTMAGAAPGEGAIVTRNASTEGTDVLRLSDGFPAEKPWFLVQTNYDHWEEDPADDNRRTSGLCLMEDVGSDSVNLATLWDVVSDDGKGKCPGSVGVYNSESIHTELIIPATGEYHTYKGHGLLSMLKDVVV